MDLQQSNEYYRDILEELDTIYYEVTLWEANFLEDIIGNTKFTPRQRQVIMQMKERYLP